MDAAMDALAANDGDLVVGDAITLVEQWVQRASTTITGAERKMADRLHEVVQDPAHVAAAMRFVGGDIRSDDPEAMERLTDLVRNRGIPGLLSPTDKALLGAGAKLASRLPTVVRPLAQRRLRQLAANLVVEGEPDALRNHIRVQRQDGHRLSLRRVGEAVLGEAGADRRLRATIDLMSRPDVDEVSIRLADITGPLNPWDIDGNVDLAIDRLRQLFTRAQTTEPSTFVTIDVLRYTDLELTIRAFTALLEEPAFHTLDAGIVLQAYLPDSYPVLRGLVAWAQRRHRATVDGAPGGVVTVRLVKGGNLAAERVEALSRGWEPAPYATKAETDANFKRCLDWALHPIRLDGVRIAVGSHNLFDLAWTHLLARERQVSHAVAFEMLHGVAPAQSRLVRQSTERMRLYTPVVERKDVEASVDLLFETAHANAGHDHVIRHLQVMRPGTPEFENEKARFTQSVAHRWGVGEEPRRAQDRRAARTPDTSVLDGTFVNEADTDPTLETNRLWMKRVLKPAPDLPKSTELASTTVIDDLVAAAHGAADRWGGLAAIDRRRILRAVAEEMAQRRADLVAVLVHEASRTVADADTEVSAAIDLARYYALAAMNVGRSPSARFTPYGVVAVAPPWTSPVSSTAGGVLAALAAGNTVVLKPAPSMPRAAEIVAECCWSSGVGEALQFARVPDNHLGRHLVTHPAVQALLFSGARETADMFLDWRPELRIHGDASAKNAMVITPEADIDAAVADLVRSAFERSGQSCTAASLAICVGDVYESSRFRRQLADAVRSLPVGPATEPGSTVGPLAAAPDPALERALKTLEPGQDWLVEPRRVGDDLWTPGIRIGVRPGSWFHRTECLGPVLGLMAVDTLDEAIDLQNEGTADMAGGLQSLDPAEIDRWTERVEVGMAFINRPMGGGIVGRQPQGGWRRSVLGPGAMAGGPNLVHRLGRWHVTDGELDDPVWLMNAAVSDARWWADEYSIEHDPAELPFERNVFRYLPLPRIAVRIQPDGLEREQRRVEAAAALCGVPVLLSDWATEPASTFAARLPGLGVERVRVIGTVDPALRAAANHAGIALVDEPVTTDGRLELAHYVREQVVSRSAHWHGHPVIELDTDPEPVDDETPPS
ncbi:MAG: bifunctional proline dehydrogenase/L-glutamate gamma-semialdehyde dehydrogenase [Actinomycetota bacterium]